MFVNPYDRLMILVYTCRDRPFPSRLDIQVHPLEETDLMEADWGVYAHARRHPHSLSSACGLCGGGDRKDVILILNEVQNDRKCSSTVVDHSVVEILSSRPMYISSSYHEVDCIYIFARY